MKDGEKDMDKGRDVPADPNLLTAPSVLTGPGADAPPLSSRETSNGLRATEGGDELGPCGHCPSCAAIDYLDTHGDVVTEVVDCGEGVWLGPDHYSFDRSTHDVVLSLRNGIAVLAIEKDSQPAQDWWLETKVAMILGSFDE